MPVQLLSGDPLGRHEESVRNLDIAVKLAEAKLGIFPVTLFSVANQRWRKSP
jgi:hypothetical protein